jgi:hypothetical protein
MDGQMKSNVNALLIGKYISPPYTANPMEPGLVVLLKAIGLSEMQ